MIIIHLLLSELGKAWVIKAKILHDVHGICHFAWSLIAVGHNLHGKIEPDKPEHYEASGYS